MAVAVESKMRKLAEDALALEAQLHSDEPCTEDEFNQADMKRQRMFPDLATALLAALDRVGELERVSRTARQAVYHCTLATGIGYWQELANAVFELEADDRE